MTNSPFEAAQLTDEFSDSLDQFMSKQEDMRQVIAEQLPVFRADTMDARTIQRILELVHQIEEKEKEGGTVKWFEGKYGIDVLPKHKAFFDAGKSYPERLFMAANRIGKSVAGAYELTCHLTGEYPSWWNGRVFDHPIEAWAVGKDARAVRDTAQKELIGAIGEYGTGMIPAHRLGKFWALQGTPQAIDIIKIKHKSGGWSTLGFKNYQQDIGSFMGTARHAIWLDEECPLDIYNECNIRTATTKGIMLVTFTPLDGLTPMVVNFCKKADFLVGAKPIVSIEQESSMDDDESDYIVGSNTPKAVVQAGWNDAPWLDEETKSRLLADTPIHLRKARTEGIPSMGDGNIYPIPLEDILVDTFAIPDSWPRMYALDVGWNRTAAVWGALDPVTDTVYLYDEHYMGKEMPAVHGYSIKARGDWVHGVIDPAARGRSQVDGSKLVETYKDLGLTLFLAKNEVESGIVNVQQRLMSRRLKVFKTLINWQKEYMLYRRDNNGKIVKEDDHLMDATRYVINNMERMISRQEVKELTGVKYAPKRYRI